MKIVQRGYEPRDEIEFGIRWREKLEKALEELVFLLNRGYGVKSASTFIGNHYMLSERQRIALARMAATDKQLFWRKEKELSHVPDTAVIDGFNTIITLEVALSGSLLIRGMDGTIRDLAGLRGTYRIIDKTEPAIRLILNWLDELNIMEAIFYLDKPVSNSGRLSELIHQISKEYRVQCSTCVINEVDQTLETMNNVITSDAIILDRCIGWYNLNARIMEQLDEEPWIFGYK